MSSKLSDHQKHLLAEVASSHGFHDYELEMSNSLRGDGNLGEIVKVTLVEGERKLHLILKSAFDTETFRRAMNIREIYLKEIFMYERVLPVLKRYNFENYAQFYGKIDDERKETLVLENLLESRYELWDRKRQMSSEHIAIVMRGYGRLHAASLAVKQRDPELFQDLVSEHLKHNLLNWEKAKKDVEVVVSSGLKCIYEYIKGYENLVESCRNFMENPLEFFIGLTKADVLVFTHGDCWCNNMLFKYEDPRNPDRPSEVCLIDWQLSRFASPVLDLSYFFFANASKEILYDYEKYLRAYHDSFGESLRAMSCDPEEIFPYSALERHWKKYSKFGLFMAPAIFKVMIVDPEDAPDLARNVKDIKDFYVELANVSKEDDREIIGAKIRVLVEYMIENGLL